MVTDILLKKISVVENGELAKGREAANLLGIETWPEEIAKLSGLKTLRLRDGETIDLARPDRVTGKPFNEKQRLLIRRELLAPVHLTVALATIDNPPAFEKFLTNLLGAAFKIGWSNLVSGVGASLIAVVAGVHLDSITCAKHSYIIGEGDCLLDPATLQSGIITVPLFVPKDVVRIATHFPSPGRPPERYPVTVLKADSTTPNAKVELQVQVY